MRFLAALCFALAFLMAIFGFHLDAFGVLAAIALGLFFLTVSWVWDFWPSRGPVAR